MDELAWAQFALRWSGLIGYLVVLIVVIPVARQRPAYWPIFTLVALWALHGLVFTSVTIIRAYGHDLGLSVTILNFWSIAVRNQAIWTVVGIGAAHIHASRNRR